MYIFKQVAAWLPTRGMSTNFPQLSASHSHALLLIPRRFEAIEAANLIFCGVYGFLVAVFLLKSALLPMVLSGALLAFGALRWRYPVRSKLQWVIDALIVLAVVACLFMDRRTDGGAGPYLFLLLLSAMMFPLLMDFSRALSYGALLLVVYFVVGRETAWNALPAQYVLRGVLIAGVCVLATGFGHILQRSEESLDQLRRDLESGAYNEHGLLRYGKPALLHCQQQGKPLSMAYLNMPLDWAQQIIEAKHFVNPRPIELRQLRSQALAEMFESLCMALPANCLVGRDAQGEWVIVMPGISSQEALLMLESSFGRPLQINFGPRDDEMFVSMMPCVVEAQKGESLLHMHARATDIWNRGVISGAV